MKRSNKEPPLKTSINSSTGQKISSQASSQITSGVNDVSGSKPDTSGSLFSMRAFNSETDLPIVYCAEYNMTMIGVEMLHQFDTKKYSKMASYLNELFLDTPYARLKQPNDAPKDQPEDPPVKRLRYLTPNRPVNREELSIHHTPGYVEQVHTEKSLIARVTETWALNLAPISVLESRILTPLKLQVAGTIYATHLAMQHGWSINLGGGFHQASADGGETFCLFSDILLAMKYVWRKHPLQKYMVIDLDAHPATGLERDILNLDAKRRKMVFTLDIFNDTINPPDAQADKGADVKVPLGRFTGDETYFNHLEQALKEAEQFKPTLIFYVAGQDILKDDQLGLMNISDHGLMKRDEIVFSFATEKLRCPIVMLMSGGYLSRGVKVQMDSIRNLWNKKLIWAGHRSGTRSLSRPRGKAAAAEPSNSKASGSKASGSKGSGSKKTIKTLQVRHSGSRSNSKKTQKDTETRGK